MAVKRNVPDTYKAFIKRFLPVSILLLFFKTEIHAQQDSGYIRRCIPSPDMYEGQPVYRHAEEVPVFGKGTADFMNYISTHFTYGTKDHITKSVFYPTFIIDTLGKVQQVCSLTKSIFLEPEEIQLMELIRQSPVWQPAIQDGKKVCFRMTVPVRVCYK